MDRHDFPMASWVIIFDHLVMSFSDDDTIFNDDRSERTTMAKFNASSGFRYSHSHVFVHNIPSRQIIRR